MLLVYVSDMKSEKENAGGALKRGCDIFYSLQDTNCTNLAEPHLSEQCSLLIFEQRKYSWCGMSVCLYYVCACMRV